MSHAAVDFWLAGSGFSENREDLITTGHDIPDAMTGAMWDGAQPPTSRKERGKWGTLSIFGRVLHQSGWR